MWQRKAVATHYVIGGVEGAGAHGTPSIGDIGEARTHRGITPRVWREIRQVPVHQKKKSIHREFVARLLMWSVKHDIITLPAGHISVRCRNAYSYSSKVQ